MVLNTAPQTHHGMTVIIIEDVPIDMTVALPSCGQWSMIRQLPVTDTSLITTLLDLGSTRQTGTTLCNCDLWGSVDAVAILARTTRSLTEACKTVACHVLDEMLGQIDAAEWRPMTTAQTLVSIHIMRGHTRKAFRRIPNAGSMMRKWHLGHEIEE
jgi:hypothetical protein